ncbi:prolipoprotein diacylglyceryl transferase [Chryseolinea sp. T2]|uniref:prolipoprotein diacylglyceryl transferase n=1 Tax=Chryseolinea sp. T2 TaxID=3129255 RepID=UPI0030774D68
MLGFISWDVDPVLIALQISGHDWSLRYYGVLFAIGFILSQQVLYYIFTKDGIQRQSVDTLTIYVVAGAIVGARLGHYLFYEWPLLVQSPGDWALEMITPPFAGLASHGGTIMMLLAVYLYTRKYQEQSYLWLLDRLAIVVGIGGCMIRLGNLFNSEIYGTPTALPWGFIFLRETDPRLLPLVPRHPTQLYEAFFCIALFLITFYMWKQRRHTLPDGVITGTLMILLFSFRFLVEFFKNNQVEFENEYLINMGQLLSLPVVLAGVIILIYAFRRRANPQVLG